jgi:hypothetical protein
MGLITAAVLSVAVLLGSRSLRWLVVTAALIFLLSVLNSWMACHAFRMEAWGMHRAGGRPPDSYRWGTRLG